MIKGNGFFIPTEIGDFHPTLSGDYRPTLTLLSQLFLSYFPFHGSSSTPKSVPDMFYSYARASIL
jgi:hypothetical protein